MIRLLLVICSVVVLAWPMAAGAQGQAASSPAGASISADQARTALDVLNDPAKRAAFAATLEALSRSQSPAVGANAGEPRDTPGGNVPAASASANSAAVPPATSDAASAAKPRATAAPATTPAPVEPAASQPAVTVVQGFTLPLAPNSLGAQVLVSASDFIGRLNAQAMHGLDTVQSLPLLYGWAVVMATNPVARDLLADVAWRLVLALACAAAAQFVLSRLVQRPVQALESIAPRHRHAEHETISAPLEAGSEDPEARAEAGELEAHDAKPSGPSTWVLLRRVPLVLARFVLELIPVLGIAVAGHLIAGSSLGGQVVSRLVILAVIDSYAVCAAVLCLARMLLSPGASRMRLFDLRDTTADYLMRWIHRLALIAVFGYAVGETGLLLGMSDVAHDLLEKSVGLVLHLCVAFIILQKRRAVRRVIRAPDGQVGFAAGVRNRVAAVWHWVALFFVVSIWLIWAVEVPHGFALMMHYFIITAAVLIGARLTLLLLLGVVDRAMRPAADKTTISPVIDARLRIYHPVVSAAFRAVIYTMCVLGLLQLYGMNTFLWLVTSTLGLRVLSAVGTIAMTIVLAFVVWEGVNASVHNHLDRLQREAQLARSARLRTLLPLLRTALLISIAVVAGLMILSEVGINIAPLLAGAGIIGVAIGFGSQKLVQDLITGLFLLLENAMQVGDWVTVSGLSGTVEALSIRAIRLRAADGSVHLIPFSSVTSVTNVNRGLGNASVNVVVSYTEDTDRVSAELKAIVDGMRTDPALSAMMLSDLQLWGVDKVDGAAVTIAGQVVCTDSGRWPVQREFNRRMKRRFQDLGIGIFSPLQTVSVTAEFPAPQREQQALLTDDTGTGGMSAKAERPATDKGRNDGHAYAAK